MPRFDGTGPAGYGPATGRGMGPCGAAMGQGRGFGCRRFFTKKEESEMLKEEVESLEQELEFSIKFQSLIEFLDLIILSFDFKRDLKVLIPHDYYHH